MWISYFLHSSHNHHNFIRMLWKCETTEFFKFTHHKLITLIWKSDRNVTNWYCYFLWFENSRLAYLLNDEWRNCHWSKKTDNLNGPILWAELERPLRFKRMILNAWLKIVNRDASPSQSLRCPITPIAKLQLLKSSFTLHIVPTTSRAIREALTESRFDW